MSADVKGSVKGTVFEIVAGVETVIRLPVLEKPPEVEPKP